MTRNIAIFLDLDNILIGANEVHLPVDIKLIVTTVEELVGGRAVLRYAYGDYRHYQQIPRLLTQAGFQLQSVVRLNNSDKNLADMQMVAEAVETMIDGYRYHCYVLVTGDRDFIPLVQVLRRHDKTVIGMGVKHTTSQSLVELCDHYIFYDDLFPDEVAVDSADL
ncbi:MAG TPA: NYN domain-containing protein, partial [Anaerolineae bacterium]|nr:NYN domain-containing protein [Anaerolineae bacterium]